MKKTIVIALGGNALLARGEALSAENQYRNIAQIADAVASLSQEYQVVIVHGNGPQVGLLALQNQAYSDSPAWPLDVLVAETQGMLGYMIAQVLGSRAGIPPVVTLLTRVEVDAADPAFRQPGKYIGPVWAAEEQSALEARYGWQMKKDGDYVRRVVPSPRPQKILERQAISQLLADGNVVICAGGGGTPVVEENGSYQGMEAVVDKDLAASVLAQSLQAEALLILTEADAVYLDWGTPKARALRTATVDDLRPLAVPDGAMGPKAEAAIQFVEMTGHPAYIGALRDAPAILRGEKGTLIAPAAVCV
ncbi:carbamate kinase [Raoultella ornithinolytica]|jgi:carbamate kinase|uniref:Carbamate kinase n=1 Tax=Raoultella ornithinolytica TaxID=54291 RepID=A0ABZ2DSR0_RAOOR|nr:MULTISPECIES: carbamate kinase [Raoultella]ALQ48815.1 Carbamate kinase [Raoultella ornithinolytica]AYW53115.1 carbamate kinase [Raoultella ornithinolytica]EHT14530.1 carbamate kinase [Raoultella ornithinolytica 10-5246]EKQ8002057.1 carbamate kinase [Raoultella ornithinolytica]EKT9523894.1 carbamate kinase [Raoultella ornithinolytica]